MKKMSKCGTERGKEGKKEREREGEGEQEQGRELSPLIIEAKKPSDWQLASWRPGIDRV